MFKRFYSIALFVTLALCGVVQAYAVPELRAMPTPPDTLVLWVMDQDINAGSALQKLMKKYTRQSGIPVKIRFVDWGAAFDELNKTLVNEAGEGTDYPDVLQLGSTWVPYFAKAGLIKPVTELLDAVDTSRFYPEAMKSTHIGRDSVVYAVPWFLDIRGLGGCVRRTQQDACKRSGRRYRLSGCIAAGLDLGALLCQGGFD